MAMTTQITPDRGLVRISGVVPDGHLEVRRNSPGVPGIILRGGAMEITNEGFSLEDTEAPVGVPVDYIAISTPINRIIQDNYVLTPDFTYGQQSWVPGLSRTISAAGLVSSNPSGATAGTPGRTIAEVAVAPQLKANTTYLFSGRMSFKTPNVWTFLDARSPGTFAQLKAAKPTYADVLSSIPSGGALTTVTTLYISLVVGTTVVVAPIPVYSVPLSQTNHLVWFSAFFTTPATMPAGTRTLRLLHGSTTREYAVTWQIDKVQITDDVTNLGAYWLLWFSGDSALPIRPSRYLMRDDSWRDTTSDADILWLGTPGNSISRFLSPSRIQLVSHIQIDPPDNAPCEPILLSDPVSSSLAQWFGLGQIGDTERPARASILDALNREDSVNSSSARGSARGEFIFYTDTLEQRFQAISILQSGRVLLLRCPDPTIPETMWYLGIGHVTESRLLPDVRRPERAWTVPYTKVERPTGLIEASTGITFAMVKATGKNYAAVRSEKKNFLDVLLTAP
jgi:hypothetical protein